MSKIAENYLEKFPEGSASRNLQDGFNGGHFCEALRSGNVSEMISRADGKNSLILYLLAHECIFGFMVNNGITREDYLTLRGKAFWFASVAKGDYS
jgi:hypothetical protein